MYCICICVYNFTCIYNGNCTDWSAIWSKIKHVITKLHDGEAGVWFLITSLISDFQINCTTRSAITTLLYSFWNHCQILVKICTIINQRWHVTKHICIHFVCIHTIFVKIIFFVDLFQSVLQSWLAIVATFL